MRRSETNGNAAFMRQAGALEEICRAPISWLGRFFLCKRAPLAYKARAQINHGA